MHHDVGRQFLKRAEMVSKRLLDKVTLLHARGADVPLEQVAGRTRNEC